MEGLKVQVRVSPAVLDCFREGECLFWTKQGSLFISTGKWVFGPYHDHVMFICQENFYSIDHIINTRLLILRCKNCFLFLPRMPLYAIDHHILEQTFETYCDWLCLIFKLPFQTLCFKRWKPHKYIWAFAIYCFIPCFERAMFPREDFVLSFSRKWTGETSKMRRPEQK